MTSEKGIVSSDCTMLEYSLHCLVGCPALPSNTGVYLYLIAHIDYLRLRTLATTFASNTKTSSHVCVRRF